MESKLNGWTKEIDLHSKPPHCCPDWDYMKIRPGDPEMECCTCRFEPKKKAAEATRGEGG